MDYNLLETFVVVSETLNITKAARLLYKTQPAITNRINQLEEYLGFELFIRQKGKRNMLLTTKGKMFLSIAKELLALYEDIDKVKNDANKTLSISSIDSIGTTIVADVAKRMVDNDGIDVVINTFKPEEAYDKVANRSVDLAFVSEREDYNYVVSQPAFEQGFFVVKPHPNPEGIKTISVKDLNVKDEIFQFLGLEFQSWHDKYFPQHNSPKVRVDSTSLVIPFLKDEDQWTIIQASNLQQIQSHTSVQIYEIEEGPAPRTCYMITNNHIDKNTKELVDLFVKYMNEYINEGNTFVKQITK